MLSMLMLQPLSSFTDTCTQNNHRIHDIKLYPLVSSLNALASRPQPKHVVHLATIQILFLYHHLSCRRHYSCRLVIIIRTHQHEENSLEDGFEVDEEVSRMLEVVVLTHLILCNHILPGVG